MKSVVVVVCECPLPGCFASSSSYYIPPLEQENHATYQASPHVDFELAFFTQPFTRGYPIVVPPLWSLHLSLSRSPEGLLYEAMLVYTFSESSLLLLFSE